MIPLPSKLSVLRGSVVKSSPAWLVLAACLVLFVFLRAHGVGHLLMWDEAQDVIAARALADGSGDDFTPRLWVHPPALPALSLLVRPLTPGFAERYEMLVLAINACAMIALFLLNRRIYGTTTALWSCFFLAVMPGAVFYDVWIKGGSVVSLATIGAVAALVGGKPLLSGLCLGFALLDKETALLPCIAVGVLALLDQRHRNPKNIAGLVVTTLLTAGWWYLFLSSTVMLWLMLATRKMADPDLGMPWYCHFEWLYADVGAVGCVLAVAGMAWMATRRGRHTTDDSTRPYAWWPLLIAMATYGGLTACPNKSPWFAMFVYPALATLQALGMANMVGACAARFPRLRCVGVAGAVACGAFMLWLVAIPPQWHEHQQRLLLPGAWARAMRTRAIATAVNTRIAPDDLLLATTLSFHHPSMHNITSPLFVYYLTNVYRIMVSCTSSFDSCASLFDTYRIDWALLTPLPGVPAAAMTNGFKTRFNLDPIILDNGTAFLYRTKELH